ncbi:MAG: hypothetical protein P8P26_01865 [Porticoccaceae bacterium]|nr:hypothetical protein [Porticoccaceae bacterium]
MRKISAQKNEPMLSRVLRSNLFGQLFERVRPGQCLLVLDMGYASSSTVQFFNWLKCRLNFLDISSPDFLGQRPEEAGHDELVEYFQAGLDLKPDMVIDICLFWDFFNYLDRQSLKAFIVALSPYIDNYSRGYSLGLLNARNHLPHCRYGIESANRHSQCEITGDQPQIYPHSQRDLSDLLDFFEIDTSRLMPHGRIEYVLFENRSSRPTKPAIF